MNEMVIKLNDNTSQWGGEREGLRQTDKRKAAGNK